MAISHTLCFPPTSSNKKCSINIIEETLEYKFFQEIVVTTFAFSQSSSYITQNIIVHFIILTFLVEDTIFLYFLNMTNKCNDKIIYW